MAKVQDLFRYLEGRLNAETVDKKLFVGEGGLEIRSNKDASEL